MSGKNRRQAEPGFVLHTYPYLETSLIAEVFTRHSGRVGLVARGARRPKSALRGLLQPFQPLLLSWFGKSELRTLHSAEWLGGLQPLRGLALMCGFYLNELLVRLLPRDDPHEQLFLDYQEGMLALGRQTDYAACLRRFEKQLLKELGYALALEREADSGAPIQPDALYTYVIELGPVAALSGENSQIQLRGATLLDMARDDYTHPVTLSQSKALMRMLLNHYLGERPLYTRQLLKDLQQL